METREPIDGPSEDQQYDPLSGCLLRLFWMLLGNVILLLCVYRISQSRNGFLGLPDLLFWATVTGLLAARYVDIVYFQGQTSQGTPASMSHWRRYATILLGISAGLWIAAHALAAF